MTGHDRHVAEGYFVEGCAECVRQYEWEREAEADFIRRHGAGIL